MVSVNVGKIASVLKDGAKTAFQQMKENPAEGSIFDAAKKLGINDSGDLQAGIELFKEDPKGTAKCAIETLHEKGFFKSLKQQAESPNEFSVDNIGKNVKADATEAKTTKAADKTETQTKATETKATETTTTAEETEETEEVAEETTTTAQDDKGASVVAEKDKEFGGILGKLGIKNTEDLNNGIKKFFDNPTETTQSAAQKLGISEEQAKKVASFVSKFA